MGGGNNFGVTNFDGRGTNLAKLFTIRSTSFGTRGKMLTQIYSNRARGDKL